MSVNYGRTGGRAYQGSKDDFWYFERLPPSARAALANASFDWSAGWYYNKWKRGARGFKTGKDVAERVREADKRTAEKLSKRKGAA